MPSLLLLVAAIGLIAAAWFVPVQPVPGGGTTLEGWFLVACGLSLVPMACARRSGSRAAVLLALLMIGIAGQLGLTRPLWLQGYRLRPSEITTGWVPVFLAAVFVQAVAVVLALRGSTTRIVRFLRDAMTPARALAGALIFLVAAANVSAFIRPGDFLALPYAVHVVIAGGFFALNLAHLVALGAALPPAGTERFRDRLGRRVASLPAWALPWGLAGLVLLASGTIAYSFLERLPHIPDEVAYLFQAECFADGRLWAPAAPAPDAFETYLVTVEQGRWFAVTPPGWPAALALGTALGLPWLINPLLGALAIPLAHALVRTWSDRRAADLVAVLLATSPWVIFISASYMTHALTLVLALGAWLALERARARGGLLLPIMAGAAIGWLTLVRQLDGVLVGGLLGLGTLGLIGPRLRWFQIFAYAATAAGTGALILLYNRAITGDPLAFPINAYTDRLWYPGANRLGFGADVGNPPGSWGPLDPFPGHGLRDVLVNTNQNVFATSFELLGWGIGSLFLVVVHALFGRQERRDRISWTWLAVLFLGYHFYWFSGGPDYGARYWYLMLLPLLWLTVRGFRTAQERLALAAPGAPARLTVLLAACVLIAALVYIPWRAVGRYRNYRGFHGGYRELVERHGLDHALVLVSTNAANDFASAFILNRARLDRPGPIFARDLGPEANAALLRAFPDREAWHVTSRALPDGGRQLELSRHDGAGLGEPDPPPR